MKKLQKQRKAIPFDFVLEELAPVNPYSQAMFGCTAIYVDDRIVLILREREDHRQDNGVWLATTAEHHESLGKLFPSMRSLNLFGPGPTGWQNLPSDAGDFEDSVLRACALVRKRDPRIGKTPQRKKPVKAKPRRR